MPFEGGVNCLDRETNTQYTHLPLELPLIIAKDATCPPQPLPAASCGRPRDQRMYGKIVESKRM